MAEIVKYNEFDIEVGSPTHERLVSEGLLEGDAESTEAGKESTVSEYGDLTRAELNELASEKGVEDPEGLPNKGAVVDAIRAAESGEGAEVEAEGDED